ncbi:MAG TPA: hypothetical protein VG963_25805 [Polyangiaceae bacterium]|jgi:peptidoglycan hydrolase CwlO-like protein|nr:hypothetical protein [Polyangiaceae bacterium]
MPEQASIKDLSEEAPGPTLRPEASVADSSKSGSQWGFVIGACIALWSMHEDVKKAQAQADDAHAEIIDLKAKIEELSGDAAEHKSKLDDLDSKMDDVDSKVDDLESRVSDLE